VNLKRIALLDSGGALAWVGKLIKLLTDDDGLSLKEIEKIKGCLLS
jgi:hypothetical protein